MHKNDALIFLSEIPIEQDSIMKTFSTTIRDKSHRFIDNLNIKNKVRKLCFLNLNKIDYMNYRKVVVLQYLSSNAAQKNYKDYLEKVYKYLQYIKLINENEENIDSVKEKDVKTWLSHKNENIITNTEKPLRYLSEEEAKNYIKTFECEFRNYIFRFIPNRSNKDKKLFIANVIDDIDIDGKKLIVTNLGKEEYRLPLVDIIQDRGIYSQAYEDSDTGGYQFRLNSVIQDKIFNEYYIKFWANNNYSIGELYKVAKQYNIPEPDSMIHLELYLKASICKVAKMPFLILGDTGVGKSYLVNSIISESEKKNYIELNCAALSHNELFQSEVFGHVKGAYSGATHNKDGYLTKFKEGIVFFDEVGEISILDQAKLLKFLDNKTYSPMGSVKTLTSEAYLIFATNRNLKEMCKNGTFRWDLYYRITLFTMKIPSFQELTIQEKKNIIQAIEKKCNTYLRQNLQNDNKVLKISTYLTIKEPVYFTKSLGKDAISFIMNEYHWPGNLREIYNTVLRAFLFSSVLEISRNHLKLYLDMTLKKQPLDPFNFEYIDIKDKNANTLLKAFKHRITKKSLDNNNGIKAKAARAIELSPQTFDNWLKNIEKE